MLWLLFDDHDHDDDGDGGCGGQKRKWPDYWMKFEKKGKEKPVMYCDQL